MDAALLALLAVAVLALVGWTLERSRLRASLVRERADRGRLETVAAGERSARERAEREAAEERVRLQAEAAERARDLEARLDRERRARAVAERSRKAERAWAQELRSQVMALHRRVGVLGGDESTPALVLRVAVDLTGAEKGLLLARKDDDGDGRLDLAAAHGFDADPARSELAQRFAKAVLRHDETVREDRPRSVAGQGSSDADAEIHNLIAIPLFLRDEFSGVVVCANREDGFDELEDQVLLALGDHAGAVLDNARLHGELRDNHLAVVGLLADAVAARDATLGGHAEQVSAYVATVAERLGVEDDRREPLIFASLLHDAGKLGISERILAKPSALTPEERTIVELHPRLGYQLLSRIPALEPVAEAVLHHHERWDGMGYPACLQGETIPLEARIIAVADAFSAMIAGRPYARRRALEDACRELEACAGTQFDPAVVEAFTAEVRARPLDVKRAGRLADALGDPELAVLASGEPMLGRGTFALIDSLTLLYSHRYLHERATAAEYRAALDGRPFAVIVLELRGLAAVNAREGYGRGDELLLDAARAAQRAAARSGGTACRHGGARLALIVPDVELAAASFVAEGLLADVPGAADPRVGLAVWEPRDTGAEVVQRALAAVRTSPVRPPGGPTAPVVRLPAARTTA